MPGAQRTAETKQEESAETDAADDEGVEKYKQEISELKEEIDTLKKD